MQKEVNEYLYLDRHRPKNDKMAVLVALRKLGRQSLRKEESISRLTNVSKLHGCYLA